MHEAAIVEQMIQLAQQELQRAGCNGRVKSVTVLVGRLSGANPEAVRFAFEALTAPLPRFAGTKLTILQPRPECRCRRCGFTGEVDGFVARCPRCESYEIELEGGRELTLQQMDVEDT